MKVNVRVRFRGRVQSHCVNQVVIISSHPTSCRIELVVISI